MNTVNKRKVPQTKSQTRIVGKLAQAHARIRELEMDSYAAGQQIKDLRSNLDRVQWLIPLVNEIELAMRRLRGG